MTRAEETPAEVTAAVEGIVITKYKERERKILDTHHHRNRHHPHLCVSCAEAIPVPLGQQFTLVPMHKGAYQPVRRDKIYEVACNPKNFDPEKGGL